jgi:hypothetical protein
MGDGEQGTVNSGQADAIRLSRYRPLPVYANGVPEGRFAKLGKRACHRSLCPIPCPYRSLSPPFTVHRSPSTVPRSPFQ